MHMRNQAERHFGVHIDFVEGFKFRSQAFEGDVEHGTSVLTDEPDPVGSNAGPSTPAMLAMAVGHCLSASLVETLRHAGEVRAFRGEGSPIQGAAAVLRW